ncbi:MAG: ribosome small subunit-dependent GTPase A [Bacillota bacterium]
MNGGTEQEALVLAGHGRRYAVETGDGKRLICLTAGREVHPVCGDRVRIEDHVAGPRILGLLPRRSLFSKADNRGRAVALAANLDRVLVALAVLPEPDAFLTDKYLASIAGMGIPAGIVFNKTDLPEAAAAMQTARLDYLESIGYPVFRASARSGAGMEDLRGVLAGGSSLLVGQSGVGKSSLLNALVPGARHRIDELSAATDEGRHTTTTTTLHRLPDGGVLLDSPGVRDLLLANRDPGSVAPLFMEFPAHAAHCRFKDCLHMQEPGCAIKAAVENGTILESRLRNYQRLVKVMQQAEERKYD